MQRINSGKPSLRVPETSDELAEAMLGPAPEAVSPVTPGTPSVDGVKAAVRSWASRCPKMPPTDLLGEVAPDAAKAVANYDQRCQDLADAASALEAAEARVGAAYRDDLAACTDAIEHGTKTPKLLAQMSTAERTVAEAALMVEAHLAVVAKAEQVAVRAVRRAAPDLHAALVGAIERLAPEGRHHLSALRAVLDARDEALADLDLVDRRFLAPNLDRGALVERPDEPRLLGRQVVEVLTTGGSRLRGAHQRTDWRPVEQYLGEGPDSALLNADDITKAMAMAPRAKRPSEPAPSTA